MHRPLPDLSFFGVRGIPEVQPGDDLAEVLLSAVTRQGLTFTAGDILVVAQKVVSKAEGRLVDLKTVTPSPFASAVAASLGKDPRQVEVILRESRRIVRMAQGVLIAETAHGFTCANAGVDRSNLPDEDLVCLLPFDPDASAHALREAIKRRTGQEIAVIISDTFGRPWREGLTNVALGVSGILPLRDYRGEKDPYGFTLRSTVIAVADELAAAAELVMGKVEEIPAVIIRGYRYPEGEGHGTDLLRREEKDLFR
ncbi:MAG: coenzyme F420-0:L-glutamate ligase [candidate division NC10 bacterium]|nr:coenzyme F420-0:L-glutamate ligase [candidate division NC10 bacterium]